MAHRLPRSWLWVAALVLAFAARLGYGVTSDFWSEDERQVYLIGLKSYARAQWPYFGADVVWTHTQLPGAMQGLLVRVPLNIWPVPESPFVLLNLLSFGALALLAWYYCRRLPELPRWLVWALLLTVPWTLNFSTHIVNTSYILPGAAVFFVGFLEASPAFRIGAIRPVMAWSMMGAGLVYLMQIHMSWVLLPAYVAFAALDALRRDRAGVVAAAAGFLAGAAVSGSVLLPTIVAYGLSATLLTQNVQFHAQSLMTQATIVARFLSFPSFELNRFLGLTLSDRLVLVWHSPWLVPLALGVGIAGLLQPVLLAFAWFRRDPGQAHWDRVRWLALVTVVWIYASFFFSVRGPLAHAFYVVFPLAALYGFHSWKTLGIYRFRRAWAVLIAANIALHAGLALARMPSRSLYADRATVEAAIGAPNDRFLGDRRTSRVESPDPAPRSIDPVSDRDAYLRARPAEDLEVVSATWSTAVMGRVSVVDLTLRNRSRVAAYLDLRYVTTYRSGNQEVVDRREGIIKRIIQPGAVLAFPVLVDGMVPAGAAALTLEIAGAEKCIPIREIR